MYNGTIHNDDRKQLTKTITQTSSGGLPHAPVQKVFFHGQCVIFKKYHSLRTHSVLRWRMTLPQGSTGIAYINIPDHKTITYPKFSFHKD